MSFVGSIGLFISPVISSKSYFLLAIEAAQALKINGQSLVCETNSRCFWEPVRIPGG